MCIRDRVKVGYPASQGCSTILRLDYPTRLRLAHRVLACGRFHPESLSQRGLIVTPGTLYRLTSKEGITPLTDYRGWNKDTFLCPVMSLRWLLVFNTAQSALSVLISNFGGTNFTFIRNYRVTQSLRAF